MVEVKDNSDNNLFTTTPKQQQEQLVSLATTQRATGRRNKRQLRQFIRQFETIIFKSPKDGCAFGLITD